MCCHCPRMFATKSLTVFTTNVIISMVLFLRTMQSQVLHTCPGQDLPSLQAYADVQELSLIFYYVSWNNESLHVKTVYEEVANYYGQHLHFGAVDCWHIACNCSAVNRWSQPTKQWPKLIAHYTGRITVQYTGHDWSSVGLRQFVDKLMYPLLRVHTKSEVKHWNMLSDAVVLGMFHSADQREYVSYVHGAFKWLEIDPLQAFRFTVALGDPAIRDILGENEPTQRPRLLFINAKGIDVFNATKWDSNQIVLWLHHRIKRIYRDLYMYTSPTTFALRLKNGPALSIFTAPDPNSKLYADLSFAHQPSQPNFCDRHGTTMLPVALSRGDVARRCVARPYLHYTNLPQYYRINEFLRSFSFHAAAQHETDPSRFYKENVCSRAVEYYVPERKVTVSKFLKRSVDNVRDQQNIGMPPHSQQNRSLSVSILDGHKHRDQLRSLGLAVPHNSSATTVLIADPQTESVYVMAGVYSYEALMEFVETFYRSPSSIGRHLKSAPPMKNNHNDNDDDNALVIPDLNGHQLHEAIQLHVNSTFLVLFYSPECTVSNIMSHSLIQVAALLKPIGDLHMVRVNVQANDLPWQYEFADSPNLIVVPRGRVRDERVYPKHIKITVPNVYAFIVKQLEATEQIRALLDTCKRRDPRTGAVQKCLHYVKNLAVHHIGRYLKRWQFFEHERHLLYDQLQALKELNNAIQRSMLL